MVAGFQFIFGREFDLLERRGFLGTFRAVALSEIGDRRLKLDV